MPSGGGTLGLLHHDGLQELSELAVDSPPLCGRRFRHRVDQHSRSHDVLASAIEDWGLLTPFVVVNAVVDVTSPPPGSSAITTTLLLMLESVSKLL